MHLDARPVHGAEATTAFPVSGLTAAQLVPFADGGALAVWADGAFRSSTYRPGAGWSAPATVQPLSPVIQISALDGSHALLVTRSGPRFSSRVFDESAGGFGEPVDVGISTTALGDATTLRGNGHGQALRTYLAADKHPDRTTVAGSLFQGGRWTALPAVPQHAGDYVRVLLAGNGAIRAVAATWQLSAPWTVTRLAAGGWSEPQPVAVLRPGAEERFAVTPDGLLVATVLAGDGVALTREGPGGAFTTPSLVCPSTDPTDVLIPADGLVINAAGQLLVSCLAQDSSIPAGAAEVSMAAPGAVPDLTTIFLPTLWPAPAGVALGDGGDAALVFESLNLRDYPSLARAPVG